MDACPSNCREDPDSEESFDTSYAAPDLVGASVDATVPDTHGRDAVGREPDLGDDTATATMSDVVFQQSPCTPKFPTPAAKNCAKPPKCFDVQSGEAGSFFSSVVHWKGGYVAVGATGAGVKRASITFVDCHGKIGPEVVCSQATSSWQSALLVTSGMLLVGIVEASSNGSLGLIASSPASGQAPWSHAVSAAKKPNTGVELLGVAETDGLIAAVGWQGPVKLASAIEVGGAADRDALAIGLTLAGDLLWQSRHPVVDMYRQVTAAGDGGFVAAGYDSDGQVRGCVVHISKTGTPDWHHCHEPQQIHSSLAFATTAAVVVDGTRVIAAGGVSSSLIVHFWRAALVTYPQIPGKPTYTIPEGAGAKKAESYMPGTDIYDIELGKDGRIVWAGRFWSAGSTPPLPAYKWDHASTVHVIDNESKLVHVWNRGNGPSGLQQIRRSAWGGYVAVGWRQKMNEPDRAWMVKLPDEDTPTCP